MSPATNSVDSSLESPIQNSSPSVVAAAAMVEPASVRQSFAYRNRMWLTGVSLVAGLVATWFLQTGKGLSLPVQMGLSLTGWGCLVAGAAIRIWASTYICARKSVAVVRSGPYSLCRNPLYWGTFLMIAAFPLILASPSLAVAMLPPIALYLFAVVPVEEAVMRSRHPQEYGDYCQSVARWFPNFSRYDRGVALDGASIGFRRECGRMIWWVAFAGIAQWVAQLVR